VRQIGESGGFEDGSYFSKTFHEMYGMTPTEYRRKSKRDERDLFPGGQQSPEKKKCKEAK